MTDLPPGWAKTSLADVCDIVSGSTPKTLEPSYWGGDIAWVTPDDLSRDRAQYISHGTRLLTQTGYDSCSARLVPAGAVVFSSRAPIGYVAIAAGPLCTNQGCKTAVPQRGLQERYLYWYLRWRTPEIASRASGTTFKEVSGRRFAETELLLPPLEEQRRIVEALEAHLSRLDSATSTLQTTSVRLATLGRAASAQLWEQSATTGMSIAVGSLGRVITGSTPSRTLAEAFGGEVPFVTPSDVGRGGEVVTTARTLSQRGAAATRVLTPGSIVTVCIGATLGKVGWSKSAVATNQQINGIELDALAARPDFVAVLMASPHFQGSMWDSASSTTLPILNKSKFAALRVPLPPRALQDAYMVEYGGISMSRRRLARDVDHATERARLLRRSLLTAAFSGRLVPQDPNDEPADLLLKRIRAERATEAPRTRRTRKAGATP